jgi:hypothetical protein
MTMKLLIPTTTIFVLFLGAAVSGQTPRAEAQSPAPKPFALSGDFSAYLETYNVDGLQPRRPDNTQRVNFRGELGFYGLQIPLYLLLSSENDPGRQAFNRLSLTPAWSWGKLHLGNSYLALSDLTLNGQVILGAGVELNPGKFRFAAVAGRADRAVAGDSLARRPGTFQRRMYAGKIGVGREAGAFLDLNVLYAKDETASRRYAFGAQPQENLAGSLRGSLFLFAKKLRLNGELAGSGHTRDLRSSRFDHEDVPRFVERIYETHLSSRFGYAYNLSAQWFFKNGGLRGEASRISPGFMTLGRPYFQNDRAEYSLSPALAFANNKWRFFGAFGLRRDNLAHDKLATTNRWRISLTTLAQLTRAFSLTGRFTNYSVENDARDSLRVIDTDTRTYSLSPALNWRGKNLSHLVRTTATYIRFDNRHAVFASGSRFENYNLNVAWTFIWRSGASLTPGVDFTRAAQPSRHSDILSPTLSASYLTRNRKINANFSLRYANGSVAFANGAKQFTFRTEAGYSPSRHDRLALEFRNMNFRTESAFIQDFTERRAALRYTRKF